MTGFQGVFLIPRGVNRGSAHHVIELLNRSAWMMTMLLQKSTLDLE